MTTSRLTDEQIGEVARIAGKSGTAVRLRRETLIALLSEVRERREGDRCPKCHDPACNYLAHGYCKAHGYASAAESPDTRTDGSNDEGPR